jgi:hypothetical protein
MLGQKLVTHSKFAEMLVQLDEEPEYEKAITRYKSKGWDWENSDWMKVVPISFHSRHKEMLAHCKLFIERGHIAINPKFDKLITSLRTAVDIDGTLDKEATAYNDIFDAFRMNLIWYRSAKQSIEENEREREYKYERDFEGVLSLR